MKENYINLLLAEQMKLSDDEISALNTLHKKIHAFKARPTYYVDPDAVNDVWTGFQYSLQLLWGFPLDKSMHKKIDD